MEAEVPASIAETSRKVHVKFTWGESGLGILEKQMASAAAVQMMEMAEGHGARRRDSRLGHRAPWTCGMAKASLDQ